MFFGLTRNTDVSAQNFGGFWKSNEAQDASRQLKRQSQLGRCQVGTHIYAS